MGSTGKLDLEEVKFSLYLLAFDSLGAESAGRQWTDREGILVCFGLGLVTKQPRFGSPTMCDIL